MPYQTITELPSSIQDALPEEALKQFLAVVNSVLEEDNATDESAFRQAWAVIKRKFKKTDEGWVRKDASEMGEERYLVPFDFADTSKLFPYGKCVWFPNGKFTKEDAEVIAQNFRDNVLERKDGKLPVNLEHNREGGRVGYVVDLHVKEDGLYGVYEWDTPDVAQKFDYTSPEIHWTWTHPYTGNKHNNVLMGVGLTNYPKLLGGTAVAKFSEQDGWEYEASQDTMDNNSDDNREKERDAQKSRSQKYGISIREDGHMTKPSEWTEVPDSEWGDPTNWLYPCPDKKQTQAALRYFGAHKDKYDDKSSTAVQNRLEAFAKKFGIGEEDNMSDENLDAVVEKAANSVFERFFKSVFNREHENTPIEDHSDDTPEQDFSEQARVLEEKLRAEFNEQLAQKENEIQSLNEAKAAVEAEMQRLSDERTSVEREKRLMEFSETSRELGVPENSGDFAETLMLFHDADNTEDKAHYNKLIAVMKALQNQGNVSALFSEAGSDGAGVSVEQKLDNLITEYAEKHSVSRAIATQAVIDANPELYLEYSNR